MNIEKLIQAASYILSKYKNPLEYIKLIKILYLADRESMGKTGYSITGDNYVSMKNGPVLSALYDLIKNRFKNKPEQYYWNSKFATSGFTIQKICPFIPDGLLSDGEIEILDETDKRFHRASYSDLINFVHNAKNCPEWRYTESSLPISRIDILKNQGFSDEEIQSVIQEEQRYRNESELLDSIPETIATE